MSVTEKEVSYKGEQDWLEINNLNKNYGDFVAVKDIQLNIKNGEFISFLGASGSGKSTTLLSIAGFLEPTSGEILLSKQSIVDKPPHKRNIGMVFQQYSLFPHMTIFENVAFPLKMRKVSKSEIQKKVNKMLDLVELEEFSDRKPSQLSGGQQQRVALARALVFEPEIILMDEPLAALDKKLRESMQMEIRQIHEKLGITVIYVTHDQEEALKMSDRIAVFNGGSIEQVGTPTELYDRPSTQYVAQFLGDSNVFYGDIKDVNDSYVTVIDKQGNQLRATTDQTFSENDHVVVMVRPEKISLNKDLNSEKTSNVLEAKITESIYLGESYKYIVKTSSDEEILIKRQINNIDEQNFKIGDTVYMTWRDENATVLLSNGVDE